jgi:hypothetical protein
MRPRIGLLGHCWATAGPLLGHCRAVGQVTVTLTLSRPVDPSGAIGALRVVWV